MAEGGSSRYRPEPCLRQGRSSIVDEVLAKGGNSEFSALDVWREGLSLDNMCTLLMRLAERGLLEFKETGESGMARYVFPEWPGTAITRACFEERIWPEARALGFPKRELFDYLESVLEEETERGIVFLSTADGWENLYAYQEAIAETMAFESGCARAFRLDDWQEGLVLVGAFAEDVKRSCPDVGGRRVLRREQRLRFLDGKDLAYWVQMTREMDHDRHLMEQHWLEVEHPECGDELGQAFLQGESDGSARRAFAPKLFGTLAAKAYEHGYVVGELATLRREELEQEA